jgi:hypothetical protein
MPSASSRVGGDMGSSLSRFAGYDSTELGRWLQPMLNIGSQVSSIALLLLTTVGILGQSSHPATFPIPAHMASYESLRPLGTGSIKTGPLEDAIRAYLRSRGEDSGFSASDFLFAAVRLGDAGQGMIVVARSSSYCGATGNCPFWLFILRDGRYEQILGAGEQARSVPPPDYVVGWAFALVPSPSGNADLIIAANGGGGHQAMLRFRLRDGRYLQDACEALTPRNPETEPDWFNPAQVIIGPCEGEASQ